jgi:leucyl aminopeptidase
MQAGLKVRLHLLIPAVENAIAGNAFRPGDVLKSRKGLTIEIGNTDAEGRLILADALHRASEFKPELIVDFATLTGAARVALGPDLPALMTRRDETAQALIDGGLASDDHVWRLPLPDAYREWLKSDIADLNNSPSNGFAGASVAGLFLDRFVGDGIDWAHFDTFAWRPAAKPGRPKGGEALGLRAAWAMLQARLGREVSLKIRRKSRILRHRPSPRPATQRIPP